MIVKPLQRARAFLQPKRGFEPFGTDYQAGMTGVGASENGIDLRLPGQWVDDTWADATSGAGIYYNVNRWAEQQTGRYIKTDPLGADGGGSYYYLYALGNPLVKADPLGLKIVSIAPDLKPYVHCALKYGPPEFREAYHHFDDPWWTGWKIRFQRPERLHAMEIPPKVPRGHRSESLPPGLIPRLFPGEFLIEPPNPGSDACQQVVRALLHEMIERYYSETHRSAHLTGLEIGAPHEFALQHDDPSHVCDNCCPLP